MAVTEAANIYCPFTQFQADLIQIALFFYLCSCNYTKMKSHRQTVQFRHEYLEFHNLDRVVPHNAPFKTFLCAWAVTLFLDTENNSDRVESTTMEATELSHQDPVSAMDWRFLHLHSHHANPDTTI